MPEATDEGWVVDLYRGMGEACREYGLSIVGGDLSRAEKVVISVTIAGEVPPGRAVTRAGAKAGDVVAVTGVLGAAAGGLFVDAKASLTDWGRRLSKAQARPVARVGEAQVLATAGATAMIDISDGLSTDLHRLCSASAVGASIESTSLPVAVELENLGRDPVGLALNGGEDYELLAVMPREGIDDAGAKLKEHFGVGLTAIGEITSAPSVLIDGHPLEAKGWDHFE
jgi:thiamine-monophosphate kinase